MQGAFNIGYLHKNDRGTTHVAVLHNTLNTAGGGERVCLAMIEAFLESGFDITLLTSEKTDWHRLENAFGTPRFRSSRFHERNALPFGIKPRIFGIYQRLIAGIYASVMYRNHFDFIINSIGDINPLMCQYTYIHYPVFLLMNDNLSKYSTSLFWKVYFAPYALYQKIYYPKYLRTTKIFYNSKFTQEALKSVFPQYAGTILYPPLDIEKFKNEDPRGRENIVVTCSRFVPEKNLQAIPKIAALTPEIQYHIIGGTNRFSGPVIAEICKEIEDLVCSNVHLHPNANVDELLQLYKHAKVYLHTMIGEHFGISIVEGMAAGLVPVVHRSGGAYLDIVDNDRYGFSYREPAEAAEKIKSIIFNSDKQNKYSQLAVERAQLFSKENFKKQFTKYITAEFDCNA